MKPTQRLYLDDDTAFAATATIVATDAQSIACDRSCFYPGGGGQPPDQGEIEFADGRRVAVTDVRADEAGVVWHTLAEMPASDWIGQTVALRVDAPRRIALTRYHTVLHILNTIALRDYDAWITGAQIGTDYSRIDFKVEGFSADMASALEAKANAVMAEGHGLRAYTLSEAEFAARGDLLRTLEVRPPIVDGRVRVVEIEGFDAQACGGTHAHDTRELGRLVIYKIENKGRINKRFYVRLES
jgi:misacylated tRNA(Ala) deacylase